jgi:GNAT superfamily N-acetyltransferase
MSTLRIESLAGAEAAPFLPALARLRIAVFRAFPYLYDGREADEQSYLTKFAASPRAGLIVAFDGATPVGCATCMPLADAGAAVAAPFVAAGIALERVFYFGESVLLDTYRGQGAGVAFFAAREAHARSHSDADLAAFCAVRRAPDHPLRPADYVPLDDFWRKRGFTPYPEMTCTMRWTQVDGAGQVENRLAFWMKSLR